MDKPSLLYFFPHVFLKDAILNQWDSFGKIVSQGPTTLKDNLVKEFNRLKEDPQEDLSKKDITLSPTDFDPILMKLNQDTDAIVVKFPTPTETTEVTHIAIILPKQPTDTPRYFTLELHRPNDMEKQLFPEKTSDRYEVCEWSKDNKHTLHKSIENPDHTVFIEEINKIVNV